MNMYMHPDAKLLERRFTACSRPSVMTLCMLSLHVVCNVQGFIRHHIGEQGRYITPWLFHNAVDVDSVHLQMSSSSASLSAAAARNIEAG